MVQADGYWYGFEISMWGGSGQDDRGVILYRVPFPYPLLGS